MHPHANDPTAPLQRPVQGATDTVVSDWAVADPTPRPPAVDEVHLWRIALDADARRHKNDVAVLATSEQQRAGRYRHDRDRVRFVSARAALRQILGAYLGLTGSDVEFQYGPHGKPRLTPHPAGELHFNFSDSGDLGLLAVGHGRPLGVDIERLRGRRNLPGLAARMFPAAEAETVAGLTGDDQVAVFYRFWTSFEARVKARGSGIFHADVASSLEADWRVHHLLPRTDSIAAVALDRSAPPARWRAYTWP